MAGHDWPMTTLKLAAALPAIDTVTVLAAETSTGPKVLSDLGSPSANRKLADALKTLPFAGKHGETILVPGTVAAVDGAIQVVGLGKDARHDELRRAVGKAGRELKGQRRWAVLVPDEHADAVAAIAEGSLLGVYRFAARISAKQPAAVSAITLVTSVASDAVAKKAVNRAKVVAEHVNHARDLSNLPPNDLSPASIAEFAKGLATEHSLKIEVLDEKALVRKGFGGITAVGMGSVNPPRLVSLSYQPAKPLASLALVGKGISFDSGGISLKPGLNMHEMKADMSGAAAVLNAVAAIARLKLPIAVTAFAACAENMPGGKAQRPGDVITAYGGRTVEVLNTDAEGRLVLMDALVRAAEDQPDLIVDVATLTGACVVALGRRYSGVMSPDDRLSEQIVDAATRSGEKMWPLPLPAEYRPNLDSPVADIANIAEPQGGALYGGIFLQDFVPANQPWAHLDIAAPAFNSTAPYDYTPKGGTGAAVRTLVTLAEDLAAGQLRL